jgi:hypothetical protein
MDRIYLSPPHMGGEERRFVQEAFASNWIAPIGPHVDSFEQEFSRRLGVRHAAALSSGVRAAFGFTPATGPFPWGPLAGSVVATLLGLVIGVSALRVRGVSLAVVTLAGAVAIEQFGFQNTTWGAGSYGSPVEQPSLGGLDLGSTASFRGLDGNVPREVERPGLLPCSAEPPLGGVGRQRR